MKSKTHSDPCNDRWVRPELPKPDRQTAEFTIYAAGDWYKKMKNEKFLYMILIAENSWENPNPMDRLNGMIQRILLMVDNLL